MPPNEEGSRYLFFELRGPSFFFDFRSKNIEFKILFL